MRTHFRHLRFKIFPMIWGIFQSNGFWPLQSLSEDSQVHRTPIPKVGTHLGVWRFIPSHFPTFPRAWDVTFEFPSWPTPLQALALVANPRLELRHNMCWNKKRNIWCRMIQNILGLAQKHQWIIYDYVVDWFCNKYLICDFLLDGQAISIA
jgi:hypothetical protein